MDPFIVYLVLAMPGIVSAYALNMSNAKQSAPPPGTPVTGGVGGAGAGAIPAGTTNPTVAVASAPADPTAMYAGAMNPQEVVIIPPNQDGISERKWTVVRGAVGLARSPAPVMVAGSVVGYALDPASVGDSQATFAEEFRTIVATDGVAPSANAGINQMLTASARAKARFTAYNLQYVDPVAGLTPVGSGGASSQSPGQSQVAQGAWDFVTSTTSAAVGAVLGGLVGGGGGGYVSGGGFGGGTNGSANGTPI